MSKYEKSEDGKLLISRDPEAVTKTDILNALEKANNVKASLKVSLQEAEAEIAKCTELLKRADELGVLEVDPIPVEVDEPQPVAPGENIPQDAKVEPQEEPGKFRV